MRTPLLVITRGGARLVDPPLKADRENFVPLRVARSDGCGIYGDRPCHGGETGIHTCLENRHPAGFVGSSPIRGIACPCKYLRNYVHRVYEDRSFCYSCQDLMGRKKANTAKDFTDKDQFIELQARDVLLNAYDGEQAIAPPIDILKIVKALGLTLKEGVFKEENVAGAYDKASKTIYIAENDPYTRKAFTIAHELGHFFLHKEKEKETFFRSNALLLDKEEKEDEQEANCFAASILMPKNIVIRYFNVTRNIERLADIFGVSNSAMSWRLKNIGLIE